MIASPQFLLAVRAGLQMPFVCSQTNELGEELVGSYLYPTKFISTTTRIQRLRPPLSGNDPYIKVKRMVCLLDRLGFEIGGIFE